MSYSFISICHGFSRVERLASFTNMQLINQGRRSNFITTAILKVAEKLSRTTFSQQLRGIIINMSCFPTNLVQCRPKCKHGVCLNNSTKNYKCRCNIGWEGKHCDKENGGERQETILKKLFSKWYGHFLNLLVNQFVWTVYIAGIDCMLLFCV